MNDPLVQALLDTPDDDGKGWRLGTVTQVSPLLVKLGAATSGQPCRSAVEVGLRVGDFVVVLLNGPDRIVIGSTTSIRSAARRSRNSAQSIPNGGETIVAYDDLEYDQLSELANTGVFTATATGIYHASWGLQLASASWFTAEIFRSALWKNGAAHSQGFRNVSASTNTATLSSIGSADVDLAAGEYIDVRAFHNQGAAVNTSTTVGAMFFCVHRIA